MTLQYFSQSLEESESSPWFMLAGRGKLRCGVKGTWAGNVTITRLGPNDVEYAVRDQDGEVADFTANTGMFVIDDAGPFRFNFDRDSGTAEVFAWSDESLIHTPFAVEGLDDLPLTWMNGEPFEWMDA